MAAPSIGVKDILVSSGVGVFLPTTGTWTVYVSKTPPEPDRTITVYDSGGTAPNPRWLLDRPDVSVIVRGKTYSETYDKAKQIKDVLLGRDAGTINGDRWLGIIQLAEIVFAGYDEKERPQFSLTFRIWIEPANNVDDNRDPL